MHAFVPKIRFDADGKPNAPASGLPGEAANPKEGFSGKVEAFTTRITPETRIALERAAARKRPVDLNLKLKFRLRISLQKPPGARGPT